MSQADFLGLLQGQVQLVDLELMPSLFEQNQSNDAGAVVGTSDSSQTDQLAKTGESNHYEWITG
jgi:hypothetical protein